MMQANFDALSYSQGAASCCHLNMTYFERSKRSDKVNIELVQDFDVVNISVKLQNDKAIMQVILFARQLDRELV